MTAKQKKNQKVDERKFEDASKVERITIDSTFVDVNISVSEQSKVEAHLYGQSNAESEIEFDVGLVNHKLRITVKTDSFIGNLKLDITVPSKVFKSISVKTSSADVFFHENISTELLEVETMSGDLNTNATFNSAYITSMSGDIDLCTNAQNDITAKASTMSGDVSAEFNNIGYIDASANSMSGDVKNHHKDQSGHYAKVNISTMSGDIRIR